MNKILFSIVLILCLLAYTACPIIDIDNYPKLEYPKAFEPIEYNENVILLSFSDYKGKNDLLLSYDVSSGKVLQKYEFPLGDNLYSISRVIQINNKIYLNPFNEAYGDVIELDLNKGSISKINHNGKQILSYQILENIIYTGTNSNIQSIDLSTNSQNNIDSDYSLSGNSSNPASGLINNKNKYIILSSAILNVETQDEIGFSDYFKIDEEINQLEIPLIVNTSDNETNYCITSTGEMYSNKVFTLYQIYDFAKSNYNELNIDIEPEEATYQRIIYEDDKKLILVTHKVFSSSEVMKIFDIEKEEFIYEVNKIPDNIYPGTCGSIVIKGNYLWWLYCDTETFDLQVVKFDLATFKQDLINIDI